MTREIGSALGEIAGTLYPACSWSRLVVDPAGHSVVRTTIWDWIPAFLHRIFSSSYATENRRTIEFFYEAFGKGRVMDISRRYGLEIDEKYRTGEALYKRDIERLFVGACDIRTEDIARLFQEVKKSPNQVRHLSEIESRQLFMGLVGKKEVSDLTKGDYDEFYKVLIPFSKIEHVFLYRCPYVTQNSPRGRGSFEATRNGVFLTEEMRRDPKLLNDDLFWHVRFAKRLIDDDLPAGMMVPHAKGYYAYERMIVGKGVCKVAFRALTETSEEFRPIMAYLSTRSDILTHTRRTLYSALQTTFRDIAVEGEEATYGKTRAYFDEPKNRVPHWLIGFSMGGSAASEDSLLFHDCTERLTTICGPAMDRETVKWFAERTKRHMAPPRIRHIVEVDDAVDQIGKAKLGYGCDPERVSVEHYTLVPLEAGTARPVQVPPRPKAPHSLPMAYYDFFYRLLHYHGRETTAMPHAVFTRHNRWDRAQMDALLDNSTGPVEDRWEYWRRFVSHGSRSEFIDFLKSKKPEPRPLNG